MDEHQIKFKIVHTNPNNLRFEFSNDFMIMHDRETFYLQFGQISPPQINSKEDLENMAMLGMIESQAIGRLAINKNYLPILIRALQDNLAKYQAANNPVTQSEGESDFL